MACLKNVTPAVVNPVQEVTDGTILTINQVDVEEEQHEENEHKTHKGTVVNMKRFESIYIFINFLMFSYG